MSRSLFLDDFYEFIYLLFDTCWIFRLKWSFACEILANMPSPMQMRHYGKCISVISFLFDCPYEKIKKKTKKRVTIFQAGLAKFDFSRLQKFHDFCSPPADPLSPLVVKFFSAYIFRSFESQIQK